MTIKIRNKEVHKEIMNRIRKLENKSIKEYAKGNLIKGNIFDKRADNLYRKNYNKMFRVIRKLRR